MGWFVVPYVIVITVIGSMVGIGVIELHQQPDIWENPKVMLLQIFPLTSVNCEQSKN